ncbi:MAG TPA: nucleotidyltransferase family protein, partial [Casimicrobiaceae bacterium]|nr:nucleotidyltransferase family protein [Casimicrobiaceae bacterium]
MNTGRIDRLATAFRDPSQLLARSASEWEVLIAQARSAKLLATLAARIERRDLMDGVPRRPAEHLRNAQLVARAQAATNAREIEHLRHALADAAREIVLLKGAAYLAARLPAADGRVFGDIDILVPRASLRDVEAALMLAGWATTHHNSYDQRY